MQFFGVLLVGWGILDFAMDKGGTDIYYDWLGIYLPDWLYNWSPAIAVSIGLAIFRAGQANVKK